MSERNWGIIVAAGLGVVSFSAVSGFMLAAQTNSQYQHREASHATTGDKERKPQQADTDHAGVPAFAERIISNPEPDEGTEREKRDLAAQENSAAWAFWLATLAAVQALLSAIGIWFIVRTLRQSEAALEHARNVSYTELRAYLGSAGPELLDRKTLYAFKTTLKNFGQTPATDVAVNHMAFYVPFPIQEPLPEFPEHEPPLTTAPILPGDERAFWTQGITMNAKRKAAITMGQACILTRLSLTYKTHAGERITEPDSIMILFGSRTEPVRLGTHHFAGHFHEKHRQQQEWEKRTTHPDLP